MIFTSCIRPKINLNMLAQLLCQLPAVRSIYHVSGCAHNLIDFMHLHFFSFSADLHNMVSSYIRFTHIDLPNTLILEDLLVDLIWMKLIYYTEIWWEMKRSSIKDMTNGENWFALYFSIKENTFPTQKKYFTLFLCAAVYFLVHTILL